MMVLISGVVGAILGSFLNALIPRLHFEEGGLLTGRSRCSECKKTLYARDLIPVLSFLFLKGKCRHCKVKLSLWYPLTEIVSALAFVALVVHMGEWSWPMLHNGFAFFILLFIFFYDLRYKEIHDLVLIPATIIMLLCGILFGDPVQTLIGAGIGFLFFAIQYWISRGQWIGSGDSRIGAFLGAFLGWPWILVGIVISYIFGSVIALILLATGQADRKTALPLGPFLVLGTLIVFFFQDPILNLYFQI